MGCETDLQNIDNSAKLTSPPSEILSDDWIGYSAGANPGKWIDNGPIQIEKNPQPIEMPVMALDESSEKLPHALPVKVAISSRSTGRRYLVETQKEDLAIISSLMDAAGMSEEHSFGGDANDSEARLMAENAASEFSSRSWSDSTDNRIRRGVGDNGYTKYTTPYKYIGQFSGGGTGTFISCKPNGFTCYILTATHILFSQSGTELFPNFYPRRDDNNYCGAVCCGTECAGTEPFGTWIVDDTMYDWNWYLHGCYSNSNWDWQCSTSDLAIVRVHQGPNAVSPGWIGRTLATQSSLNNYTKYSRGYPSCGCVSSPYNCSLTPNILWGDGAISLGGFYYADEDGWATIMLNSSDASPGNSGSPLYEFKDGSYYIFGVQTALYDSTSGDSTPNWARRLTPVWADIINWYLSF